MNEQNLTKLRELLLDEFNEEQLATLCQDIGINYAELGGVGAFGKTREIVEVARSRRLLNALAARVRDLRPEAYTATGIAGAGAESARESIPRPRMPREPAQPTSPDVMQTPFSALTGQDTTQDDAENNAPAPAVAHAPPPTSLMSGRVRAIAVIVGALLLVVALLTVMLPKPGAEPPAATPAPTTISSPLPTTIAGAATTDAAGAAPMTATVASATTAQPASTSAGASTKSPTPEPTETVSETHPAAQAVHAINDQLIAFYQGKATSDDLKQHWSGGAYQTILTFAYTTLNRKLGVDLTADDPLSVTLRYVRRPALVKESGNTVQVNTREYWGYTNPTSKRSMCETRDYVYTLIKNGDVYQVRELRSNLVAAKCEK
ncbi:MAG: hypothetical protein M1546_27550 [Chloroflexi bacterium]|nr:hypothetical protein [Chloroflexota bacterium]